MRIAKVFFQDTLAGQFAESDDAQRFTFDYEKNYTGPPISLTMPVRAASYEFDGFPPFFDGLLPEGFQLEALLRGKKLDRADKFRQLLEVGADTVGAVTVKEIL